MKIVKAILPYHHLKKKKNTYIKRNDRAKMTYM